MTEDGRGSLYRFKRYFVSIISVAILVAVVLAAVEMESDQKQHQAIIAVIIGAGFFMYYLAWPRLTDPIRGIGLIVLGIVSVVTMVISGIIPVQADTVFMLLFLAAAVAASIIDPIVDLPTRITGVVWVGAGLAIFGSVWSGFIEPGLRRSPIDFMIFGFFMTLIGLKMLYDPEWYNEYLQNISYDDK